MPNSVVWFKKDLRVHDHAALAAAVKRGRVCCLYIIEPSLWRSPDASTQHYEFTLESLRDLYLEIKRLGGCCMLSPVKRWRSCSDCMLSCRLMRCIHIRKPAMR